jgi:predicted component of type VI protein secretion system
MFLILEVTGPLAAELGSTARQVFDTKGGTIGRHPGCTWVLPDPHVSTQHAVITFDGGTFLIEDTSLNGVSINTPDNRIPRHTPTPLQSGDMIFVEPYEVQVQIVSKLSDVAEHPAPAKGTKKAPTAKKPKPPKPAAPVLGPPRLPAPGSVRKEASLTVSAARFAVYAPPRMQRGQRSVLEVWAYRPELHENVAKEATRHGRAELLASKGPLSIQVGKTLTVTVLLSGFFVHPAADSALWDGEKANTSFLLTAETKTNAGLHVGTATILSGTVPITLIHFGVWLDDQPLNEPTTEISIGQRRVNAIFASYASEDRVEVLQWARGAAVAGVDVFVDVLKLREGSTWEDELRHHVTAKDLFCLFWSEPASRSRWVEMEWRWALNSKGLDYIHPVPLVDPRTVPPPQELKDKHFSDVMFLVREYEKEHRKSSIASDDDTAQP